MKESHIPTPFLDIPQSPVADTFAIVLPLGIGLSGFAIAYLVLSSRKINTRDKKINTESVDLTCEEAESVINPRYYNLSLGCILLTIALANAVFWWDMLVPEGLTPALEFVSVGAGSLMMMLSTFASCFVGVFLLQYFSNRH